MTWRDGVHLAGTQIWCDARRSRGLWFVSSLERVDRAQRTAISRGVGQLIATDATLAMLGLGRNGRGHGDLGAPLRQRFTVGTVRLEVMPSGRGLGAAAMLADVGGRSVLYAGSIRTRRGGLGEPGEVRSCDAVVVGAPYGAPHHEFPPIDEVAAQLIAWVRTQLAADRKPVLFVDTALDAIEVASRLAAAVPIHPMLPQQHVRDVARAARRFAEVPPLIRPAAVAARDRHAVVHVYVDGDRASAVDRVWNRPVTALVSGRAIDGADGCDAGFVWAGAAGHDELVSWIEATHARDVYVTGRYAEAIATAIGPRARVLGPPKQMTLFKAG